MNRVALILAFVLGTAGAGLVWLYKQRLEQEIGGGPPVGVLVVRSDVPLGTRITESHLAIREIPEAYLDVRHILASEVQSVIGVRTGIGLEANDSLFWTDLSTGATAERNLADLVKVGMRAVSVPTPTGSGFGGLLKPGDRVDVSLTIELPQTRERVTSLVAQNVLVLAIGSDTGDGMPRDRARDPGAADVTLAVTMEQAQALTLAKDQGKVNLLLRNHEDTRVLVDLPETRGADVARGAPVIPKDGAAARPARPPTDALEETLDALVKEAAKVSGDDDDDNDDDDNDHDEKKEARRKR